MKHKIKNAYIVNRLARKQREKKAFEKTTGVSYDLRVSNLNSGVTEY